MNGVRVVVVGGSGAIGGELAGILSAAGARVVVAGRDRPRLEAVAARTGALAEHVEATDSASVDALFDRSTEVLGGLDAVVSCVGSVLLKPAHRTSPEEWGQVLATNLSSAFWVVRAAGRVMTGGGAVVLTSTAAAQVGLPNHEAIAAAKAGIEGLVRSAAATYAPRNLRFNVVAPGLVRTPLTAGIVNHAPSLAASLALHAVRRVGEPGDVARMMAFLVDPRNDWITGEVFSVDGGLGRIKAR
jgi:NAD(P)-dependent dehydrogenase (short-subunit alcohol dehydrogenase family)